MTALRRWILEQTARPMPEDLRHQTPDAVLVERYWGLSKTEQTEFQWTVQQLLTEAHRHDLREGIWMFRVRHLALVAGELELASSKLPLLFLAHQELPEALMNWVLFGLAGVQVGPSLWNFWWKRWSSATPTLGPVLTLGLRLCDPERMLQVLPAMVERVKTDPWLGDFLWSCATALPEEATFIAAMSALPPEDQRLCHAALTTMGASPEELLRWIPGFA